MAYRFEASRVTGGNAVFPRNRLCFTLCRIGVLRCDYRDKRRTHYPSKRIYPIRCGGNSRFVIVIN